MSSHSVLIDNDDDESDSQSVVYSHSVEEKKKKEENDDDDDTPILPADFSEDDSTRFSSTIQEEQEQENNEENGKNKNISMSTRLKNVWNRKTNEETKNDTEKKGKEEKVSKFSKLLPMGKTKKEPVQEGMDMNTEIVSAPVENTVTTLNTSDEIKEGGKKKWEIDQRICYRKCIMTRCYLTNEKNVKDIKARFIKNT